MNAVLDLAPALLFFVTYLLSDLYVATGVLIGALFGLVLIYWLRERRIHKAHLITAIVAGVLGGLTLYIHDPNFIKLKPTVVYSIFGLVLLGSHLIGDKVLLARLPQKVLQMPDSVWRRVNFIWALFFFGLAALNLYVAQTMSEATWVKFRTFGFSALMFVFLLAHAPFLKDYFPKENAQEKT